MRGADPWREPDAETGVADAATEGIIVGQHELRLRFDHRLKQRMNLFAQAIASPFLGVGAVDQFGVSIAQMLDHIAADQHQPGTEPRQFDQIGQRETLIGGHEAEGIIAREFGEVGGVFPAQPALCGASDIAPGDRPPRHRPAEHRAIGLSRHRPHQRKHIVRRKIDVGIDEQQMGEIAVEENVRQHVAGAVDRRLMQDEGKVDNNARRLRRQRQGQGRADIGALRRIVHRRRHHQAAIGKRRVGGRQRASRHLALPPLYNNRCY